MGPAINYFQLVQPHVCDALSIEKTKRFWRVRQFDILDDDYDFSETDLSLMRSWYYVSEKRYQEYYHRYALSSHENSDSIPPNDVGQDVNAVTDNLSSFHEVDVDLYTCNHFRDCLKSDYEDGIQVMRYEHDADDYIHPSSTFELGKLYDVNHMGDTYASRYNYPYALNDFPISTYGGYYTGPILEVLTKHLVQAGSTIFHQDFSLDATTMFAFIC